jgi:TfoX/Sxy family transcriptional regulator of competence genes
VPSDVGFVEYVCEQIRGAGQVSHRRMFGEFAVYCDGKVVALVCDNQFFLKPTDAGKALLDRVKEAPPYPGAKPYYLIDAQLDDAEAAAALVRATAAALPVPAAKPARKAAKKAPRGRTAGRATRPAK